MQKNRSYVLPSAIIAAAVIVGGGWMFFDAMEAGPTKAALSMKQRATMQMPFLQLEDGTFSASTFAGSVLAKPGQLSYHIKTSDGMTAIAEHLPGAAVIAGEASPTIVNIYKDKDVREGLHSYKSVSYNGLWKGIDLSVVAHADTVEKIFTVAPGAQPSAIRLSIPSASSLIVQEDGSLAVTTAEGTAVLSAPVATQTVNGQTQDVSVSYAVNGKEYGFAVGSYNPALPLVIDPLLGGTYFGGNYYEVGEDYSRVSVAADDDGESHHVFLSGKTYSFDLPVTDASEHQNDDGGGDAFIAKFSDDLTTLYAATYFGGNFIDDPTDMALDSDSNVYIVGMTYSSGMPFTNPFQSWSGGYDGFVAAFSSNLQLRAGTYFGGSGQDYAYTIDAHGDSNESEVVIGGQSASSDLPGLTGTYQTSFAEGATQDGFVALFGAYLDNPSADFDDRLWLSATTFMGSQDAVVRDVQLPNFTDVYVAGSVASNPFDGDVDGQSYHGDADGFVAIMPSTLAWGTFTYVGGSSEDNIRAMALGLDGEGAVDKIYVAGKTRSDDFEGISTATALDEDSQTDAFVASLSPDFTTMSAATYIGGWGEEYAESLVASGSLVYVAGTTSSTNFPITEGSFYRDRYAENSFLMRLNSVTLDSIAAMVWGANGWTYIYDLALGHLGIYFAGTTFGNDLRIGTDGAFPAHAEDDGASDDFVAYLSFDLSAECGDGVRSPTDGDDSDEECDDGNTSNGDGCSSVCHVESGYVCTGAVTSTCNLIDCGDGLIQGDEECDDDNTSSGDGCSSTCTAEEGFVCADEPSMCSPIVCGDGAMQGDEYCDDGNTDDGDGCSATCTIEPALVGHWAFDSEEHLTTDSSVYENDGTLEDLGGNLPVYSAETAPTPFGNGGSMLFDGTNAYMRVATFSHVPSSALTVCAWVKTEESFLGIMQQGRSSGDAATEYVFRINEDGKLNFWDAGDSYGFSYNSQQSDTAVNDGEWHHVCFTKDLTQGTYYLDGVEDGTVTAAANVSYSANDFVIGKDYRDNNAFFDGYIDDARVYNYALSCEDIAELAGVTPHCSSSSSSSSSSEDSVGSGRGGGGGRGGRGAQLGGTAAPVRNSTNLAPAGHPAAEKKPRTNVIVNDPAGIRIFHDVWNDDWFGGYVKKVAELKIFEGYKDHQGKSLGKFGPADPITIGQLAKVAMTIAKVEVDGKTVGDQWALPYIEGARGRKLSEFLGSVDVNAKATRGAVTQTVLEALGIKIGSDTSSFIDVSAGHPNAKAIATAKKLGIVSGDDGTGEFRPDAPINRAEVAKIIIQAWNLSH